MSDPTPKTPEVSPYVEPLTAASIDTHGDANATVQEQIPLTARSRQRVLRIAPPIDDGFRPFRVF